MKEEKTVKKVLAAVVVGALFLSTLTPALASTAAEISGNGENSDNSVEVTTQQEQVVVQQNQAVVSNVINVDVSSGNNQANDNTNGDVAVHTGAATVNTNVNNEVNANVAVIEDCTGCNEDVGAKVSGNGADSTNEVDVSSLTLAEIFQENFAVIDNQVNTDVRSGYNEANRNTGGNVTITTGSATANTNVNNSANANWAAVVSDPDNGGSGWKGAEISGNGANSFNTVGIAQEHFTTIVQSNWADIFNLINTDVSSGNNQANDNTGGGVAIHTGTATANINLTNQANFNFAEVECCRFIKTAKVSGNGADSTNEVNFAQADSLLVFQNGEDAVDEVSNFDGASLVFDNWVKVYPRSGENEANRNTGPEEEDPVVVTTGAVNANVNVTNEGGLNVFVRGDSPSWIELPSFDFDFDFGEVFDHLFG